MSFLTSFRKFVPVPIEYEFRAFVVNNKLRAMCQYYHYLFFPKLVQNKDKIDQLVHEKFEELKDVVPIPDKTYVRPTQHHSSCSARLFISLHKVIDWAVDLDNGKTYIIELNPFGDYEGMGTSPSMFKLHISNMDRRGPERDLFFGDGKYEFRIETEEGDPAQMNHLLCDDWKHLFAECFGSN